MKKIKYTVAAIAIFLLPVLVFISYKPAAYIELPFKALAFSQYDLGDWRGALTVDVTQDIRLYKDGTGYFLLNGILNTEGKNYIFNREIVLEKGRKISLNTFRYSIKKIVISPTDTTRKGEADRLLAEFTSEPHTLQLDIYNLGGNTFLIGGPVSFLITGAGY